MARTVSRAVGLAPKAPDTTAQAVASQQASQAQERATQAQEEATALNRQAVERQTQDLDRQEAERDRTERARRRRLAGRLSLLNTETGIERSVTETLQTRLGG